MMRLKCIDARNGNTCGKEHTMHGARTLKEGRQQQDLAEDDGD